MGGGGKKRKEGWKEGRGEEEKEGRVERMKKRRESKRKRGAIGFSEIQKGESNGVETKGNAEERKIFSNSSMSMWEVSGGSIPMAGFRASWRARPTSFGSEDKIGDSSGV